MISFRISLNFLCFLHFKSADKQKLARQDRFSASKTFAQHSIYKGFFTFRLPCYVWRALGFTTRFNKTVERAAECSRSCNHESPLFHFMLSFCNCDLTAQQDITISGHTQTHTVWK